MKNRCQIVWISEGQNGQYGESSFYTKKYICGQNVGDDLVLKHRQFNFLCKFCSNLLTKIQGIKCFLKSGTDVSKYGNMAENRS